MQSPPSPDNETLNPTVDDATTTIASTSAALFGLAAVELSRVVVKQEGGLSAEDRNNNVEMAMDDGSKRKHKEVVEPNYSAVEPSRVFVKQESGLSADEERNHDNNNHNSNVEMVMDDGSKRKHNEVVEPNSSAGSPKKRQKQHQTEGGTTDNSNHSTNNGTDKSNRSTSLEVKIKLEEETFQPEATLEASMQRKQHVELQINLGQDKLTAAKTRLKDCDENRTSLEAALEKHEHLQQEVQTSSAKSQERVSRLADGLLEVGQLLSDDVVKEEPTEKVAQETAIEQNCNTKPPLGAKKESLIEPGCSSNQQGSPPPQQQQEQLAQPTLKEGLPSTTVAKVNEIPILTKMQKKATARPAAKDANGKQLQVVAAVFLPKPSTFWSAKRDSLSLMTFLEGVSSAELICKMMDIRAMEAMAWDINFHHLNGQYRLESLWNTCVDFCIVCHIRPSPAPTMTSLDEQEKMVASTEITTAADSSLMIDPDIAMCPHELTGTCDDVLCSFQHHSEQRDSNMVSEAKEPATTISAASAIDPIVALCPYELTGVCVDSLCPYQHLNPRPTVPTLPHELFPLPSLKLPPKIVGPANIKLQKSALSSQDWKPVNNKTIVQASESSVDAIADSEDFVTTPDAVATTIDESNDESGVEDGLEVWHLRNKHANEVPHEFWWMEDGQTTSRNKQLISPFTILECLKQVGGFQLKPSKRNQFVIDSLPYIGCKPLSFLDVIKYVARTIDCARLAVHAGRFDLALGLVRGCQSFVKQKQPLETRALLPMNTTQALIEAMEVARVTVEAGRCYDAHHQNALIAAFENQALLGIMSTLIHDFYNHLIDPKEAEQSQEHHTTFITLLKHIREAATAEGDFRKSDGSSLEGEKILEGCFELFNAEPLSLSSALEEGELDCFRDSDFRDARVLLATFLSSRSVYLDIAKSTYFASHRHELLESFWKEAKLHLVSSGPRELQVAIAVGLVLLGCMGNMVDSLPDKQRFDPTTVAELESFDRVMHNIVSCLRDSYLRFSFGDVLVAPLVAATVSLAVLLRNYSNAQHRIEDAMMAVGCVGQTKWPIMAMSDLLWSQLVILRSSLPFDPECTNRSVKEPIKPLPVDITACHQQLADTIVSFGVHLNYVTLDGDWNLLQINAKRCLSQARLAIRNRLFPSTVQLVEKSTKCPFQSGFIQDNPLQRRETFNRHSQCISAFPQSTFLVGHIARKLEVNKCFLPDLPLTFGCHFPNLALLDLGKNALQDIPDSIGCLVNLQTLILSNNGLQELPESIGNLIRLQFLNVSNNQLTTLPATMAQLIELKDFRGAKNGLSEVPSSLLLCKNLEVLDISYNQLLTSVSPSFLTSYFPKLNNLILNPQRVTDMDMDSVAEQSTNYESKKTDETSQEATPPRKKWKAKKKKNAATNDNETADPLP